MSYLLLVAIIGLLAWRYGGSGAGTPPPAVTAAIGATFGPWAEHGPRCQCSPCR